MSKLFNPLFDDLSKSKHEIAANYEPVEETTSAVLSPYSRKPMVKVTCAGIPAYYDEETRSVIPIQKDQ